MSKMTDGDNQVVMEDMKRNFEISTIVDNEVCKTLDIKNNAASNFDFLEKGVDIIDHLSKGGKQKTTIINEANLYSVIFKSNKPNAFETGATILRGTCEALKYSES